MTIYWRSTVRPPCPGLDDRAAGPELHPLPHDQETDMSRRPNILDEKVLEEANRHRNEQEPNPEEEGQPGRAGRDRWGGGA